MNLKYIQYVVKKGGRAAFGRPPNLCGYIRYVFDLYFDYFHVYLDSFNFTLDLPLIYI